MMRVVALLVAVLVSASFLAADADAAVHRRRHHLKTAGIFCGEQLDHSIRATNDLIGCTGTAITITNPGVTLDLGGHHIASDGNSGDAGVASSASHVTVTDGSIAGFTAGVLFTNASFCAASKLSIFGGLSGVLVSTSSNCRLTGVRAEGAHRGIDLAGASLTTVQSFSVNDASTDAVQDFGGNQNTIRKGRLRNNGGGIDVVGTQSDHVLENTITGGYADGITVDSTSGQNAIERNRISLNEENGIHDSAPGETIVGNTVSHNGSIGIFVDATDPSQVRLIANKAFDNLGLGLSAPPGTPNSKNKARGNDVHQCTPSLSCYVA